VRLSEKGKLVERITLKIKIYENGKWEWKVRQRFVKEPRLEVADFLKILDEVKKEILTVEEKHPVEEKP
jgi:hypothetical protein